MHRVEMMHLSMALRVPTQDAGTGGGTIVHVR